MIRFHEMWNSGASFTEIVRNLRKYHIEIAVLILNQSIGFGKYVEWNIEKINGKVL